MLKHSPQVLVTAVFYQQFFKGVLVRVVPTAFGMGVSTLLKRRARDQRHTTLVASCAIQKCCFFRDARDEMLRFRHAERAV